LINRTEKQIAITVFILVIVIAFGGCKNAGDKSLIEKDQKQKVLTAADSLAIRSQETSVSGLGESAARISKLENRLEKFILVLEQKEKTLLSRENKLLELEQTLDEKAALLTEKEIAVIKLETMSWIILCIGALGIVAGAFVIGVYHKKQSNLQSRVDNEAVEPVKPDLKSNSKEEMKTTPAIKKSTQTRKRQTKPAKTKPKTETKPKAESKAKPKPKKASIPSKKKSKDE